MAKILVLYYQPLIGDNAYNLVCLYDSMFNELKNLGNDLLLINMFLFKKDYFSPVISNESTIIKEVKNFSPDLVIAFNNQIFSKLFGITDCPIIIMDADSYDLFSCKELFKKNIEKYTMITLCNNWVKDYIDLGFSPEKVHHVPLATAVKKEDLLQDKNISFIGTFFHTSANTFNKVGVEKRRYFYDAYLEFLQNHNYDYKSYFPEDLGLKKIDCHPFFDIRILTLAHLLDLGLTLHGMLWEALKDTFPQLYCAYDSTPKFSLKHNQDLYNSSKICLNINHPQCHGYAFGWRVFDIMASNGCLISTESSELRKCTKGWVDIPMFHSPIEARELCVKLLKNDNMRKDIVEASQKYVETNCRWIDRFKDIEDIVNVKLINESNNATISYFNDNKRNKEKKKSRLFHLNTRFFKKVSLNIDLERI